MSRIELLKAFVYTIGQTYIGEFVLTAIFATPVIDLSLASECTSTDIDQFEGLGCVVTTNSNRDKYKDCYDLKHILKLCRLILIV